MADSSARTAEGSGGPAAAALAPRRSAPSVCGRRGLHSTCMSGPRRALVSCAPICAALPSGVFVALLASCRRQRGRHELAGAQQGEPESPAVSSRGSSDCHSSHCCDALPSPSFHHWWRAECSDCEALIINLNWSGEASRSDAEELRMLPIGGCFGDEPSAISLRDMFRQSPSPLQAHAIRSWRVASSA